ncbi:hypothetical protein [Empedobacter tilapiae]
MKKKLTYTFLILFSFYFINSCTDNEINEGIKTEEINGLKKGTNEYNLGVLKIFKFENDRGFIDEKLAKDLGFSSEQIKQFKEEVNNSNAIIQEEINKGAEIESFNPNNLTPEEILNQKEFEDVNPQKKSTEDDQGSISGTISTTDSSPKSVSFYNPGYGKCRFVPKSKVNTYPVYTLTTTINYQTERVVRMIPNVGVSVGVEVPYKVKMGQAKISFATSDKKGGSSKYSNLY